VSLLEAIWVDKYRPKSIDDVVFSGEQKDDFARYVKSREIPHLCLYGPPGGGKTTIALILASPYGVLNNPNDNLLEINGSAKSSRGIGFVEDVIVPFLKLPPMGNDKHKIVFIDEADYLTDASFHSLRNPVERFSKTTRFVFTCNYVSKLPEALQSRFQFYEFKQMSIEYVTNHCKNILESEKIKYKEKDIQYIVSNLYPDIRRIVNSLQRCSVTGELKVNKDVVLTTEKLVIAATIEIIAAIMNNENSKIGKKVNEILKLISEKDIEFRSLYSSLFFTKNVPPPVKIIINKYTNEHGSCLVPNMHFMSLIFDIIQCLKSYGK